MRAAGRVASLKHGHLHYCARAAQTSHGWQFSELRKFRAVFRDRRDVMQSGGFIGTVDSAEPVVLLTLPMGNYTAIVRGVGAMPTGLALFEIYPQ